MSNAQEVFMASAQDVLLSVIDVATNPVEPRFLLSGASLFPGESSQRANWRGIGASPYAFSAVVEAACETMEGLGNSSINIMHLVQSAERDGYFAFEGSVHDMRHTSAEEAAKGDNGLVREVRMKPVSIVMRRLPFLEDYEIFRLV